MKKKFIFFTIVFFVISCTSTKEEYDTFTINDGYLDVAECSSDGEILLVDIYFSFDQRFPKGMKSKSEQYIISERMRSYLMIEARFFIRDFFAQYPFSRLVEILSDEENNEAYESFLVYLSDKKQYMDISIDSFTLKLRI